MTDYVKLNTSIQTGSNADTVKRDADGNKEAVIELRLPNNIFKAPNGQKVESVEMETTKLRLSLENTPIAQIPLDSDLSTEDLKVTKCQLDVYPYCLLDDNQLAPTPGDTDASFAFPNYKNHFVTFVVRLFLDATVTYFVLDEIRVQTNSGEFSIPQNPVLQQALVDCFLPKVEHMMNLCPQSNHEKFSVNGSELMVKSIGTLQQMLQDSLENAVTFASTSNETVVFADFIIASPSYANLSVLSPTVYDFSAYGEQYSRVVAWRMSVDSEHSSSSCSLSDACKPQIQLGGQTMSIAYDSAAFDKCVPVVWNTPYVNTYDQPEQLTIDSIRKNSWSVPPPKRMYKYGVSVTDNPDAYNFALKHPVTCAAMNIVGNEAMKNTFSFLPWIKVDTTQISAFNTNRGKYRVTNTIKCNVDSSYSTSRVWVLKNGQDIGSLRYTGGKMATINYRIDNVSQPCIRFKFVLDHAIDNMDEFCLADVTDVEIPEVSSAGSVGGNISVSEQSIHNWYPLELLHPLNNTTACTYRQWLPVENADFPGYSISKSVSNLPLKARISPTSGNTPANTLYKFRWLPEYTTEQWAYTAYVFYNTKQTPKMVIVPGKYPDAIDIEQNEVFMYWKTSWFIDPASLWRYGSSLSGTIEAEAVSYSTWCRASVHVERSVVEFSETTSPRSLVLPNLKLDGDAFYILDGTTAQVNVGNQEVLNNQQFLFNIDTTRVRTERDTYDDNGCAIVLFDPEGESIPGSITVDDGTDTSRNGVQRSDLPTQKHMTCSYNISDYSLQEGQGYNLPPNAAAGNYIVLQYSGTRSTLAQWGTELLRSWGPEISNVSVQAMGQHYPDILYSRAGVSSYTTDTTPTDPVLLSRRQSNDVSLSPSTVSNNWVGSSRTLTLFSPPPDMVQDIYLCVKDSGKLVYARMFSSHDEFGQILSFWMYRLVDPTDDIAGWQSPQAVMNQAVDASLSKGVTYKTFGTSADDPNPEATVNYFFYLGDQHMSNSGQMEYGRLYGYGCVKNVDSFTDTTTCSAADPEYVGNNRLTFTWDNLPTVVLSPIASIVLTLDGMKLTEEIQPINAGQPGSSSLTQSNPVIENYYTLAQTLRDLHDELVITRQQYDVNSKYTLTPLSGQERTITLSARYITKDGKMHQIYIPPNGVFSLQLTFRVHFVPLPPSYMY